MSHVNRSDVIAAEIKEKKRAEAEARRAEQAKKAPVMEFEIEEVFDMSAALKQLKAMEKKMGQIERAHQVQAEGGQLVCAVVVPVCQNVLLLTYITEQKSAESIGCRRRDACQNCRVAKTNQFGAVGGGFFKQCAGRQKLQGRRNFLVDYSLCASYAFDCCGGVLVSCDATPFAVGSA